MAKAWKLALRGAAVAALPLSLVGASLTTAGANGNGATWPAVAKQAKIVAEVPSAVAKSGTLTVASDATYAPMEYLAGDGTTVVGVDADLMKAVSQVLGLKLQMDNVTFDSIIPKLQSGTYDIGASSFTDTKAREKQVNFVDYFVAGEGFYVKKGHKALSGTGLSQLCGLTVSVESGTTEEADAHTANSLCVKTHKKGVTVLSLADQATANTKVASGQADVGFADSEVAAYIVAQSHGVFANSGKPYGNAPYGLAISKVSSVAGLNKAVLDAVNYLIKSGTYGKILTYWGQTSGGVKVATANKATS